MKPILFNTEMVEATLKGIKTATRRLVKDNGLYTYCAYPPSRIYRDGDMFNVLWRYGESVTGYAIKPPYLPGDILYVRERWRVGAWSGPGFPLMAFDYADGTCGPMMDITDRDMFLRLVDQSREDARKANCKFDGIDYVWDKGRAPTRWRPSIHMPKEAARLFLRVTDVRVERLQEITDEGARAEGVNPIGNPRTQFAVLWETTIREDAHADYGWAANPWVWVIEFSRISEEEANAL